jgi:energy-coupling factor transporter ATP-binding protein EcfA2
MPIDFTLLNKTVMLAGKRGSGKSVLTKQLIQDERHLFGNRIFLFSPTEQINRDYEGIIPPNHIFGDWNEKWGDVLLKKLSTTPKSELKPILLLFDDMGSQASLEKSSIFTNFFVRGRHYYISLIFCGQYVYQLPKICRSNLDFVLASQQNAQSVDILTDEFNVNLKPDEFKKLYKQVTQDYNFFLINNNSVKNDNQDSIYGKLKAEI